MAGTLQATPHRIGVSAVDDYSSALAATLRSNAALSTSSSVEQWFLLEHANPRIRTRTIDSLVEVRYTHMGEEKVILTVSCPNA